MNALKSWNFTLFNFILSFFLSCQQVSGAPSPRFGAPMAPTYFDSQLILFGGTGEAGILGDTWNWNAFSWTQLFPTNSPSPRTNALMALDFSSKQLILFGGIDAQGVPNNETWSWDGSNWVQLFPKVSPPASVGQGGRIGGMVFDSSSNQLILLSLGDGSTWAWDGSNWAQQPPFPFSLLQSNNFIGMAQISGKVYVLLHTDDFNVPSINTVSWNGQQWDSNATPVKCCNSNGICCYNPNNCDCILDDTMLVTYDPRSVALVLTPDPFLDNIDTSDFNGQFISTLPIEGTPPPAVIGPSLSRFRSQFILFGGRDVVTSKILGQTWNYNEGEWHLLSPVAVTAISPNQGQLGTQVTITGSNFQNVTTVNFGAISTTNFTVNSNNQITAIAPFNVGVVDITVTTTTGTSLPISADQFTYHVAIPVVNSLSPTSGPTTGGTTVTLIGSNFLGTTEIDFGGVPATSFTVISDTEIKVVSPPHDQEFALITVTNLSGTSNPTYHDLFAYKSAGLCSGSFTNINPFPNLSKNSDDFSWTVEQDQVIGASAGTGKIIQQKLMAISHIPGKAIYTITSKGKVPGSSKTKKITVTVNPTPVVTAIPSSETICSGTSTQIALSSNVPNTSFIWDVSQTNVSGATPCFSSCGDTIQQTLTATSTTPGKVVYTIIPFANGCVGKSIDVTVTVEPLPASPTHFHGKIKKCHHGRKIIDVLTWKASPNPSVTAYSLFQGDQLISTIPATGTFKVLVPQRSERNCRLYRLIALTDKQCQSQPVEVRLPKKCRNHSD